jgi:hypothetical protein
VAAFLNPDPPKPRRRTKRPASKPAASEAEWQRTVIRCAQLNGWRVNHVRTTAETRADGTIRHTTATRIKGWPDLELLRPGRFIMAELKSDTGRLTPDQARTIADLQAAGVDVFVWRPKDWEVVQSTLARRRVSH